MIKRPSTERMIAKKDGPIGWMQFNNPARHNAVSVDMWKAVPEIMAEFASDDAIRVVVLSGAGGKAFVSGADISEFGEKRSSPATVLEYNRIAGQRERRHHRVRQADNRDDPGLLHRRRARRRAVLRSPACRGGLPFRSSCRQARAGLCV